MNFTNRCQLNGKTYTMELNCTPAQLHEGFIAWNNGALLQDAFYFLNVGEREFIKTGITPALWEEMFGSEEDWNEIEAAADKSASDANERAYCGTID